MASIDINPFRFAGGDVKAGQKYTVNEIGREMFIGNNGKSKILEGGIQTFKPNQSGFILPHFMVDAMEQVQNRVSESIANAGGGHGELAALAEAMASQKQPTVYDISVIIKGDVSKEVNIERAVRKAIAAAESEKAERE
jgi:hypothetical protein